MSGGPRLPKIPRFPRKILPTKVEMRAEKGPPSTAKEVVNADNWKPPPCKNALVMLEKEEQTKRKQTAQEGYQERQKKRDEKKRKMEEQLNGFKDLFEAGLHNLPKGSKRD